MPSHKALRPFSAHFPNFFTSNSITPDHTLHTFPHHTCHMCVHIFIFSLQISSHLFLHLGKFYSTSILCREGSGTSLQYSCLENAIDGGAWCTVVHGVAKSLTRLSDLTFTFHFHAWEKKMATHSSVLAWRIPGTGEPGGLPSMGSHRVGHD